MISLFVVGACRDIFIIVGVNTVFPNWEHCNFIIGMTGMTYVCGESPYGA